MPTVIKDVIAPGVYRKKVVNPKTNKIEDWFIELTREEIEQLRDETNQMSKEGYQIPFWVEHVSGNDQKSLPVHSSDTETIQEYENDPFFLGWVDSKTDVSVDDDGVLHLPLDVSDETATKLEKTGGLVSQQFGPWEDKKRNVKRRGISHLALTRDPVNKDQTSKFRRSELQTVPIAQLSGIIQFSLDQKIQFADTSDDASISSQTGKKEVSLTFQLLRQMGIVIDEQSPLRLQERFAQSLLDFVTKFVGGADSNSNYQDTNMVITMSNETKKADDQTVTKIEDGVTTPDHAGDIDTLKEQLVQMGNLVKATTEANKHLMSQMATFRVSEVTGRIDAAFNSGRTSKVIADQLKESLGKWQFSETAPQPSDVLSQLEMIEANPEGTFWSSSERMSKMQFSETSMGMAGTDPDMQNLTQEQILAKANEILGVVAK